MAEGWRRWFVADGRIRAPWRAALFVAAFLAILQLELILLPALVTIPAPEDRLSAGLIAQGLLLLGAAVLAGWAMLAWVDRRPLSDLGFGVTPRVLLELAAGLAIGAGVVASTVVLLALAGAYRYVAEPGSILGWLSVAGLSLAAFAIPAAAEEAVFRGYFFRTLVDGAGAIVAVAVTSVLFTLLHGANPYVTTFGLVNIALAGTLLGVAVLRTGTLWFATALHLGWNWAIAGPLDLPVSGLAGYDVPLYDALGTGPVWLTGGEFGPEGGLAGTFAALLALAVVIGITRPGSRLAGDHDNGRGFDSDR